MGHRGDPPRDAPHLGRHRVEVGLGRLVAHLAGAVAPDEPDELDEPDDAGPASATCTDSHSWPYHGWSLEAAEALATAVAAGVEGLPSITV